MPVGGTEARDFAMVTMVEKLALLWKMLNTWSLSAELNDRVTWRSWTASLPDVVTFGVVVEAII